MMSKYPLLGMTLVELQSLAKTTGYARLCRQADRILALR